MSKLHLSMLRRTGLKQEKSDDSEEEVAELVGQEGLR